MNINIKPEFILDSSRTVEELSYAGENEHFIATYLELTRNELNEQYRDELMKGYARRRAEVVAMLFDAARKGDTQAILRLEELGRPGTGLR